jgi:hypothetical protein
VKRSETPRRDYRRTNVRLGENPMPYGSRRKGGSAMHNNIRPIVSSVGTYACGFAIALSVAPAEAVESFRIRQLYSNQTGYNQFIELEEMVGNNGQADFAGTTLKVTNHAGVTKTFVFPHDLADMNTAGRRVTIASQYLAETLQFPECIACASIVVDYVAPNLFLPTDGGTIELEADAPWTFGPLPADGVHSLMRTSEIVKAAATTFSGENVRDYYGSGIFVVEYYNAGLDHYFLSGSQPDIDAIESGRIAGWNRTGVELLAYSLPRAEFFFAAPGTASPVCRYYIPPDQGDSHFFSAAADECEAVGAQHPDYTLESREAFYAWLPDRETGHCPYECTVYGPCTVPVYRLWNQRIDSNHRFTTNRALRDSMVDQGWVSEGYGPNRVAMCVQ